MHQKHLPPAHATARRVWSLLADNGVQHLRPLGTPHHHEGLHVQPARADTTLVHVAGELPPDVLSDADRVLTLFGWTVRYGPDGTHVTARRPSTGDVGRG